MISLTDNLHFALFFLRLSDIEVNVLAKVFAGLFLFRQNSSNFSRLFAFADIDL